VRRGAIPSPESNMRPDELSALAAIDLLEMMFKSGVIAVRRLARSIDEVFRDAVCRLQDFSVRPR
jgi:hypothetical protein